MTNVISLKLLMPNAFLLCGEKDILIDTGSPADFSALTRQLNKHGVEVGDLALVVLTATTNLILSIDSCLFLASQA